MKQRVTLADLSRKTGLSQATISMILARRSDVSFSEKTIRIVQDAAREMGYAKCGRKRLSLFSKNTIMLVCPFILNHYYSAVVQTIQAAAAEAQCNVLVYTTYNSPDEEARIIKVMGEADAGGLIFAMMPQSRTLLRKIANIVPIVLIADEDPAVDLDLVKLHNYKAGSLMARHLAELGHKHIIFISTPLSDSFPARMKRFAGLRDTWQEVCPEGSLRLFTDYVSPAMVRSNIQMERFLGQEIMLGLLDQGLADYTAIVAVNDMLAYGILDSLQAHGKKVPEDVSVCGLDNDFPSDLVGISLTSVEHFMTHNAQQAFRMLHARISPSIQSRNSIALKNIQPELVVRNSTAKPARPIPSSAACE